MFSSMSMTTTLTTCTMNSRQHCSGGSVQYGRRGYTLPKISFIDSKSTFADHCGEFETSHKLFCQRIEKLKFNVQELQRDLTLRRCLIKTSAVTDLQEEIIDLKKDLDNLFLLTENKQPSLEKHWEEVIKKMATEQEVFKGQLSDILRLKQETGHMNTILTQLSSFVKSIASVTERLAPKLTQSSKESDHDSNIAAMFEEISTMQPDSQHRVDAIRLAEEERETLTAVNRVNPLDEELIKTKGLLKAPSARREGISRRNSTKRDSREFKDTSSADSSPLKEAEPSVLPKSNDKSAEKMEASKGAEIVLKENMGNPDDVKKNLVMSMEDSCNGDVLYSRCPDIEKSQEDTDVSKINGSVDETDTCTSKSCVPNVEITDCSNALKEDKASVKTDTLEDLKG